MERELKFRAWDAEFSKMVYTTYGSEYHKADLIKGNLRVATNDSEGDTISLDIMQFTGLFDKNGKEIYEGDICRTYSKDYPKDKLVIWNSMMACFEFDYPFGKSILQKDFIEVIGNKYENAELLETSETPSA